MEMNATMGHTAAGFQRMSHFQRNQIYLSFVFSRPNTAKCLHIGTTKIQHLLVNIIHVLHNIPHDSATTFQNINQ